MHLTRLLNIFFSPFYAPDGGETGNSGDFMSGALNDLGEFDAGEAPDKNNDGIEDVDDDLDAKDDDDDDLDEKKDDDTEDDKKSDNKGKDEKPIRDARRVDSDDKEDESGDKKDETKDDKKQDEAQAEVEPKDLTPRALKESYPKIFKEFPELKDVIFQNREYNKIFGSVEDATEAREKAAILDDISQTTLRGDPTELINALEQTARGRTEEFASNMLTEIRRSNSDMYYRITDPVIASALKAAETHATKSGDKNLLLATKYLSTFVFGDQAIPAFNGTKRKEIDPEKIEFERQKKIEAEQRYAEHQKTIYDYTERKLDQMIREGLDPDNVYNNFVREALADKVMSRIGQSLKVDKAFQGQMAALWKKAHKEGFTREAKQRIAHTYLAKAKRIMPAIRSKIRSEAAPGDNGSNRNGKRDEKKVITSGGGSGNADRKRIPNDPKKIDWKNVTDEDILSSD